jgi:uncharacterized protein
MKNKNMDTQTILIIIATGLVAGVLGGAIGIGGGIIIVPALVYFLGYSQHTAQGTSLGLIMLPVGILGFLQYYKSGTATGETISFAVIGILAIGFVLGSYLGSRFALSLPQDALKKFFAVFLIILSIKMLFFDKATKKLTAQDSKTAVIHKG